jgi:hypothetical protein
MKSRYAHGDYFLSGGNGLRRHHKDIKADTMTFIHRRVGRTLATGMRRKPATDIDFRLIFRTTNQDRSSDFDVVLLTTRGMRGVLLVGKAGVSREG